jgi:hypothetical protein
MRSHLHNIPFLYEEPFEKISECQFELCVKFGLFSSDTDQN